MVEIPSYFRRRWAVAREETQLWGRKKLLTTLPITLLAVFLQGRDSSRPLGLIALLMRDAVLAYLAVSIAEFLWNYHQAPAIIDADLRSQLDAAQAALDEQQRKGPPVEMSITSLEDGHGDSQVFYLHVHLLNRDEATTSFLGPWQLVTKTRDGAVIEQLNGTTTGLLNPVRQGEVRDFPLIFGYRGALQRGTAKFAVRYELSTEDIHGRKLVAIHSTVRE
jgi:hypothetical protein